MSTPAPNYSTAQQFRDLNRRMAEDILDAEPAPYAEGGYVRRVIDIRGRSSGHIHSVPIAVITLSGRRYVVSPRRRRNWVQNLLAAPDCALRSRDARETCYATLIEAPALVAEVISTYIALMNAPWAVAQFPFPPDASPHQIAQAAAEVAVFELTPDGTE